MSIQDFLDSMENSCEPAPLSEDPDAKGSALFRWSAKGVGFGELYFFVADDKVYCHNEMMSKAFIKKVLCDMVDNAIMTDPNEKDKEHE